MRVQQFPSAKDSIFDLVDFFDTHDMGDLWAQMPEVDFEIDPRRRKHLVAEKQAIVSELREVRCYTPPGGEDDRGRGSDDHD